MNSCYYSNRGSYWLAFLCIFLIITISFGNFSGFIIETDFGNKNVYKSTVAYLTLSVAITFLLINFLLIKVRLNFKGISVFYILIFWLVLVQFFPKDVAQSAKNVIVIFLTQALVIMVANIFWRFPFKQLLNFIIGYIHIIMMISLFLHLKVAGKIEFGNHEMEARLSGLFYYAETGLIAGFGIILSSFQFFKAIDKLNKILYCLSIIILLVYLLATDMRTVMTACGIAIFIQFFIKRRSEKKSIWPLALLLCVYIGASQLYKENLESSDINSDFGTRELIWSIDKKVISQSPFLGYGGFSEYSKKINEVAHTDGEYYLQFKLLDLGDPHSSFFSLIMQAGYVALVFFGFYILIIFINIRYLKGFNKALISLIIYSLVCGVSWLKLFNFTFSIDCIFFELSFFGLMLHPEIRSQYKLA